MKKLRIGLICVGFMGKTHLWSVRNLPFFYKTAELGFEAEVTAVCASSLPRAQAFADEYRQKGQTLLDETLPLCGAGYEKILGMVK